MAAVVERLAPMLHIDPVEKLPPEITSEIFSYLDPGSLLTASLASRSWRDRIFDSRLWRELYTKEGWRVDIDAIRKYEQDHSKASSPQIRKSRTRHADSELGVPKLKKRMPSDWLDIRLPRSIEHSNPSGSMELETNSMLHDVEGDHLMSDAPAEVLAPSSPTCHMLKSPRSSILTRLPSGAAKMNWQHLFKQRRRLEENWVKGRYTTFRLPHPDHPEEEHTECVYAVQFSGRWLVSGSRDATLRVWDLDTKRLRYPPLEGHKKSVLCLQFDPSPEEDVIMSGSSDKSVIVWKFSTGEKTHQIHSAHEDSILNLRFDKRFVVTCSKDKLIKVWNRRELAANDPDYPKVRRTAGVTYPSYIVDTSDIPPAALEAKIVNGHIQSVMPYSLLMALEGHSAAINAIQLHEDEIVSASGDRLIKVWNIRTGACTRTIMGHKKGIACVQFDSRRIISGSNDNTVRIFDHASGAEVGCLAGHSNLVRSVQAGFGDPPGAEEAMRLEALAVENDYWDAKRSGALDDHVLYSRSRRGYHQDTTGSRHPRDIAALGAKIPPGGGGSKWARIVSGSYDETIIIWKKDREGKWVVSHRLRQADAARAARASSRGDRGTRGLPSRASRRGEPILAGDFPLRHPPATALGATSTGPAAGAASAAPGDTTHARAVLAPAAAAAGTTAATAVASVPQPDQAASLLAAAADEQGHARIPTLNQVFAIHAHHQQGRPIDLQHHHPTSRVFKLQFDARKIVCASQDTAIVGWDFACDDEEIIEACQFFVGL